jgi:hypothetical protein
MAHKITINVRDAGENQYDMDYEDEFGNDVHSLVIWTNWETERKKVSWRARYVDDPQGNVWRPFEVEFAPGDSPFPRTDFISSVGGSGHSTPEKVHNTGGLYKYTARVRVSPNGASPLWVHQDPDIQIQEIGDKHMHWFVGIGAVIGAVLGYLAFKKFAMAKEYQWQVDYPRRTKAARPPVYLGKGD